MVQESVVLAGVTEIWSGAALPPARWLRAGRCMAALRMCMRTLLHQPRYHVAHSTRTAKREDRGQEEAGHKRRFQRPHLLIPHSALVKEFKVMDALCSASLALKAVPRPASVRPCTPSLACGLPSTPTWPVAG